MEASKVRISDQVWAFNKLNQKRRIKLREQAVLDVIRSTPTGQPINMRRFTFAARLKNDANAWQFVTRMEKQGKVVKVSKHGRNGVVYEIPGDVTVKPPVATPKDEPSHCDHAAIIEQYARDYIWQDIDTGADVAAMKRLIKFVKENKQ